MVEKKIKEFDAIAEEDLWKKYSKTKEQDIRDYFVIKYARS